MQCEALVIQCSNIEVIPMYFQAKGWGDFEKKIRGSYWTALKMNWKVWTPFQFININFVPVQVCISLASCHWAKDESHSLLTPLMFFTLCVPVSALLFAFSSEYCLPTWSPCFGTPTLHLWGNEASCDVLTGNKPGGKLLLHSGLAVNCTTVYLFLIWRIILTE